ncbi:hypothetical protein H5410_023336, partial [Solanum commersonii]
MLYFRLAREKGRKTKTTKLIMGGIGSTWLERVNGLRRRMCLKRQLGVQEKSSRFGRATKIVKQIEETWKNQSKNPNKRPISQFENLPFDPTDDSTFPEEKLPKNEEISNVKEDDNDNDTIKLVESCQQQGNKLDE